MGEFNSQDIIIVTGASSGLGKATALNLIKEGATVVGIARNQEKLEETKKESAHPENFYIETRDLGKDIEKIDVWIKSLKEKYGKFRGLAYCAGILEMRPMRALDYFDMKNLFNINYYAPVFMTKAIADKRNNIGKGTSIVAISSIAAFLNEKGMTTYSGSKSALTASLRCMAKEAANIGIRINTVLPSYIKTPMSLNPELVNLVGDRNKLYPFGTGEPDDVANMIVYLLSDKAKWITAQSYVIDCGII